MSEPKFTPWPWKADLERYPIFIESETERWPLPDEVEGWTSAFVANVGDNKANAHLIAAAPELYEALEEVLAAERFSNRPPETITQAEEKLRRIEQAVVKAEAALAKARGEG